MNAQAIPRQRSGFKLAELEGECMLYSGTDAKALYLNDTATMIWKLCDGKRTIAAIGGLLNDAYPETPEVSADIDAALKLLIEYGAVEVP